ncbi:cytochrome C assembly family protein [Magnetofaba australis]|uniref:Putative cytochrome C assembly protein n=1 Tax=Magnetofaba australis IT-1 TaxID=1434232 RepID=A0A1Y2K3I0_9PROT|nr:cytochrome c biogenesis protein CcsA [Magnetofaba australis]OSM02591.1 putative cytochrome C assembly protein [Magnetofaba australis IT-1]
MLGYAAASAMIIINHQQGVRQPSVMSWWFAAVAWFLHLQLLAGQLTQGAGGLTLDLSASLAWITGAVGGLYLIGWRLRRNEGRSVGLVLMPLITVALLASYVVPHKPSVTHSIHDPLLMAHLGLSLAAYGLFTIATVLAGLDAFQERSLKTKHMGKLFSLLPPIGVIEETLFFLLSLGFVTLSLSIVTGIAYTHSHHGVWFVFSHKVVFTWITWALIGALLIGHHVYGWRGRRAVNLTALSYLFLVLAYLGVKVVTEFILVK